MARAYPNKTLSSKRIEPCGLAAILAARSVKPTWDNSFDTKPVEMIKKLLSTAVSALPSSARSVVRDRYWQIKSRWLYQTLYGFLELENTLPSGIALQVKSKGEWWVYNDVFVNGEYDAPILRALEKCSPDQPLTVLDLGANVGYFTLRVADLVRQKYPGCRVDITMVEASPKVFSELQARMSSQALPEVILHMVQGLVGKRSGSAALRESAIHVKNSIMDGGGRETVPFLNLDSCLQHVDEIDLLKCDIEGAELLFLENYESLLTKVKSAVFELHHEMCDTSKCLEILRRNGFRAIELRTTPTFSVTFLTRD